jgi:toxin ParE1/3/4
MARALRYHPLFDCDVREAAWWYDRRSAGLGDAFVDQVSQCVAEIIADPERFAIGPSGCRYVRVSRFPYVVLFDVVADELLIFGVLHTARSMEKWRERQSGM